MSVAMSCHLTSTHFPLLRVLAGQTERSATREAIYIRGARLCLWRAHPDAAQRHRAHASGIERSAGHFQTSGGGVGSRKQLSQGHPPQSVDCPCRQRAGLGLRPRRRGDPCALAGGPPEGTAGGPPAPSAQGSVEQSGGAQVGSTPTPSQTSLLVLWSCSLAWACLAACKQGARA